MTKITFTDGKPVLRDGKVGTEQACCCNNPACCQHYCNKMCCNQIKWVVPGYTDFFTTVDGINCRASLTIPETSVQIRVLVRCSGYVYGSGIYGDPYQDCDTDCEIIAVDYSEDSGETWTTTPPESATGVTWSIYCPGGGEQPEAEASAQRCAAITALNAEQCEAVDGEPCSLPCQDCTLPCGPDPTEWRLISDYGDVWFSGDIIENPLYGTTPEPLCTDPCDDDFPVGPAQARFLLEHFPFVDQFCNKRPAGWPRPTFDYLVLEVLGCGAGWAQVKGFCGCYFGSPTEGGIFFTFYDATNVCLVDVQPPFGIKFQSPPDCACLRDPATGAKIGNTLSGPFCCPQCNKWLTWDGVGCNTGLEYLGHLEAVRFTGAVDKEGSNLWNWQDANGDSPAGTWPTGAIVIAGELLSWRADKGDPPNNGDLSYPSVTLEPGSKLAISLTTETLTVDDATIEAFPYVNGYGSGPWSCANGFDATVRITVTGTATFTNGGENQADDGETYQGYSLFPGTTAGITGDCVFETGSKNTGTIRGNCTFTDANNDGKIEGNCTFTGTAANTGSIWGTCTFSGDSVNTGTVEGDATFTDNARNEGTVTGTCTFSGDSVNTGTVEGDATFTNSSFSGDPTLGGVITGTITFSSATPVSFVQSGSSVWSADASAWVFTTSGQNWTFSSTSSNTGTVNGNATFGGSSVNNGGTVTGNATFSGNSQMNGGSVTGTATFAGDACWVSGTAGTFDPDPPPAC